MKRVFLLALTACTTLKPGSDEIKTDPCTKCSSDQICCDAQCFAIDARRCYACDAACSVEEPICSSALRACSCTAESCVPSAKLCGAGGSCEACAVLEPDALDVFVDAAFAFDGTGVEGCPFRTITAALTAIGEREGAVVHVAAGEYSADRGEVFPLVLQGGVSLAGAGIGATIIRGDGDFRSSLVESPEDDTSIRTTIRAGDGRAFTGITDLELHPSTPVFAGSGVYCDRGNAADPTEPQPEPNTLVERVLFGPGFVYALVATTGPDTLHGGCALRVRACDFGGSESGILAANGGSRRDAWQSLDIGDSSFHDLGTELHFGVGILPHYGTSAAHIHGNTFSDSDVAIHFAAASVLRGQDAINDVENNLIQNMRLIGVDVQLASVVRNLEGNTFEGTRIARPSQLFAPALIVRAEAELARAPRVLRARRNRFFGNDVAIHVHWPRAVLSPEVTPFDFGSPNDPGENIIACNSAIAGVDPGLPELIIDAPGSNFTFMAEGNIWDHVPQRNFEGSGRNGTEYWVTQVGPLLDRLDGTLTDEPCPPDRDR